MARFSFIRFFRDLHAALPDHDALKVDLTGKTVIVTESNIGLGFEAAKHFARMNPQKLILAVRNEEKGKKALEAIRVETGYKGGEVWVVDLEDFASISMFADRFEKEGGGRLDIVVENAGIALGQHYKTKDGWERTLQTNHLATVLFGLLLLPYLSKTNVDGPTPRLVVVSSEAHLFLKPSQKELKASNILERLNDKDKSDQQAKYPLTKLFNIFFVRSLASHLPPSNPLIATSLNPGFCQSHIDVNLTPPLSWIIPPLRRLIARTTEVGSRTLVHAAVGSPGKRNFHGQYLDRCQVAEISDLGLSGMGQEVQEKIWKETLDILKKVDPRVEHIEREYL